MQPKEMKIVLFPDDKEFHLANLRVLQREDRANGGSGMLRVVIDSEKLTPSALIPSPLLFMKLSSYRGEPLEKHVLGTIETYEIIPVGERLQDLKDRLSPLLDKAEEEAIASGIRSLRPRNPFK
jgi:hypothetical protein